MGRSIGCGPSLGTDSRRRRSRVLRTNMGRLGTFVSPVREIQVLDDIEVDVDNNFSTERKKVNLQGTTRERAGCKPHSDVPQ